MRAAVLRSDRNNRKPIGIPDGEISPIYLGATTKTEMGAQGMSIYGMFDRDSVRSRGPMTNRKYVLGPGSDLVDIPLHHPPSKVCRPTNPSSTKGPDRHGLGVSEFLHLGGYYRDVPSGVGYARRYPMTLQRRYPWGRRG